MKCIKEIIGEILKELGRAPRNVADDESWTYSPLIELMMLLYDERSKDVQNEESYGIGKTNIAKAIFKLSIVNCFTGKVEMITLRSQLILEKSKEKEKESKKRNMKQIKKAIKFVEKSTEKEFEFMGIVEKEQL
ncbi:hypothetical protein F0562_022519 [Nyssa sinensis]|uniref:Uncharacterized protein n=1 Tax=Nyssa sinensis TaxID=561372 RepID=A0A5J5BT68_9ASTE|nr:hypothetical protein F0562_022519 [Nyssa sinensis]